MTNRQFLDRLFYLLLAAAILTMYVAYWLYLTATSNPLTPSYLRSEWATTIMAAAALVDLLVIICAFTLVAYYNHKQSTPANAG